MLQIDLFWFVPPRKNKTQNFNFTTSITRIQHNKRLACFNQKSGKSAVENSLIKIIYVDVENKKAQVK